MAFACLPDPVTCVTHMIIVRDILFSDEFRTPHLGGPVEDRPDRAVEGHPVRVRYAGQWHAEGPRLGADEGARQGDQAHRRRDEEATR